MPPRIRSQHAVCTWNNAPRCIYTPRCLNLSTTAPALASIPPESPKFVDVPKSLQPSAIKLREMKGILPVPRKIFPHVPSPSDIDKTSPAYLLAVTPEPKPKPEGAPPPFTDPTTAAFTSWKARLAEARRRNLREGLIELSHRKKVSDGIRNQRSKRKVQERERLVAAPMREDERLTNPTILQSQLPVRLRRGGKPQALPNPDGWERILDARARAVEHLERRKEERRDDLHTLYMNANRFITSEAQLNAVVERVFDDQEQFKNSYYRGENVWNLGYQVTVAEMLDYSRRGSRLVDVARKGQMVKDRYKQIAETLTGGKM
ncbi:MAG: hypothetical protein Q9195_003085 [Heterodermia aff. obscurata]